ncbi:hypothetical protein ANN_00782 [Periplaneta americana]|uniref:Reverse transcriptase domain-containing protein n=1 Tax=Periplaneta americana TaxID=6978 RepID=A0ABQ8TRQ8_PERAM|nr:hypothetical protein ANN_00782 [Periplaneta americana]
MHRLMNDLLCTTDSPMGFNEGIIILIPKKMTPTIMKDFRPITRLLNADCKLFSKIIANRIRPYLPSLLGNEQKCGIASGNKEKAALLSLDFQGAFDNMHHQYMFQIMRRMKIPNLIINAINFLYTDAHSRVQINGYFTHPIKLQSAVRQGCPLSMLLYSLCSEPLIRMLQAHLTRYIPQDNLFSTIAYADDIVIRLRHPNQMADLQRILRSYELASTAKINLQKSTLLPLGNWPVDRSFAEIPINDRVKILGMIIHADNAKNAGTKLDTIVEVHTIYSSST